MDWKKLTVASGRGTKKTYISIDKEFTGGWFIVRVATTLSASMLVSTRSSLLLFLPEKHRNADLAIIVVVGADLLRAMLWLLK